MQQPGPSAGRLIAEPVRLAPDGVWLAAVSPRRWWALTPPFHPYLRRLARSVAGGLLSVPLSVGFRRLGRPSVLPCGVRTFLERLAAPAVTRPARESLAPILATTGAPAWEARFPISRRSRCDASFWPPRWRLPSRLQPEWRWRRATAARQSKRA